MTLPASPPLNLLQALAEFGIGSGNLLQLLRAPGGVVPNSPGNAGVPQSAPINLLQLLGAQNLSLQMVAGSASDSVAVGTASCSIGPNADAFFKRTQHGVTDNAFQWLLAGSANQADVYFELLSGTAPTGAAINTWINCATNPVWSYVQSTIGSKTCTARIHLAPAGSGASFVTYATWTMSVDKSA